MAEYTETTAAGLVTRLSTVVAGDIINLTAGNTYDTTSGFILRNHGGTSPITIRSSAYASIPANQRVCPGDLAKMPILRSTATNTQAIGAAQSAGYWTLQGLAITTTATNNTVLVYYPSLTVEDADESDMPHHMVIDRCLIYGNPTLMTATSGSRRGLWFDVMEGAITNCSIYDFREDPADSQAILIVQGRDILIENNYLEAAGENVMFGGVRTTITGFITHDCIVRGNTFSKPLKWNTWHPDFNTVPGAAVEVTGPGTVTCTGTTCTTSVAHGLSSSFPYTNHVRLANGEDRRMATWISTTQFTIPTPFSADPVASAWTRVKVWGIKNLFEIKHGERILIEGNYFERSWKSGQSGVGILFTPLNDSTYAPWHRVRDITFRWNWIKNVVRGFSLLAKDPGYLAGPSSLYTAGGSGSTTMLVGPGLITTVGINLTSTAPHGLVVGDVVRLSGGAIQGQAREVVTVPSDTTATLLDNAGFSAGFTANQTDQTYEIWRDYEPAQAITIEQNVVEHIGAGEGGYYWDGITPGPGLMINIDQAPADITLSHNTFSPDATTYSSYPFYLGSVANPVTRPTITNNITSFGPSGPFGGDNAGANGNTNLANFTIDPVTLGNVAYGTGASATNQPPGNYWEPLVANVGWDSQAASRFELTSGTHRAGQANDATDGSDVGANVRRVRARVFGRHGLGQGW